MNALLTVNYLIDNDYSNLTTAVMEAISLVALYYWCGLIAKPLRISMIVEKVNNIVDWVSHQRESTIYQTGYFKILRRTLFQQWGIYSRIELIRDRYYLHYLDLNVLLTNVL